jgi:Uma2 family endonuclease
MSTTVAKDKNSREKAAVDVLIQQLEEEPTARRRLAMLLANSPQASVSPDRMTYEEFLEWADEDTLAEWVNGEVITSSPASLRHQDIADFLVSILRMFVTSRDLGIVLSAPFQMKIEHGREPDILFVAKPHLTRLQGTYLDGPADLVVEIISPESIGRDRGEKFYEYERAGVPEYWLIDPLTQRAEFYRYSSGAHRYTLMGYEAGGIYRSTVLPDFWLREDWLWQDPLPHSIEILGEITGINAQDVQRFMRFLQGMSQQDM